MNYNKWSIWVTVALSTLSLIGSIISYIKANTWWINLNFAILGSCIISFIVSFINYLCLAKESIRAILLSIYNINLKGNLKIYLAKNSNDYALGTIYEIVEIVETESYIAYIQLIDHKNGLLLGRLSKKNKSLQRLINGIQDIIEECQELSHYLEYKEEHAIENKEKIIAMLDAIISNDKYYKECLKLAQTYIRNINSLQELDSVEEIKRSYAQRCMIKIDKNNQK